MQAKGWASRVHQRVWEVPDLPCGEGAMRAARIGRGFSALFALLIWAMRSVQGTEHWVARASGALRLAARAMGVDTVREVRRGGCGGQLGGQQGRERENREGERARRLSRGGQWACRARIGCARDALQGGASRTGMRAQGTVSRAEGARAAGIAARGGPPYFFRVAEFFWWRREDGVCARRHQVCGLLRARVIKHRYIGPPATSAAHLAKKEAFQRGRCPPPITALSPHQLHPSTVSTSASTRRRCCTGGS